MRTEDVQDLRVAELAEQVLEDLVACLLVGRAAHAVRRLVDARHLWRRPGHGALDNVDRNELVVEKLSGTLLADRLLEALHRLRGARRCTRARAARARRRLVLLEDGRDHLAARKDGEHLDRRRLDLQQRGEGALDRLAAEDGDGRAIEQLEDEGHDLVAHAGLVVGAREHRCVLVQRLHRPRMLHALLEGGHIHLVRAGHLLQLERLVEIVLEGGKGLRVGLLDEVVDRAIGLQRVARDRRARARLEHHWRLGGEVSIRGAEVCGELCTKVSILNGTRLGDELAGDQKPLGWHLASRLRFFERRLSLRHIDVDVSRFERHRQLVSCEVLPLEGSPLGAVCRGSGKICGAFEAARMLASI